MTTLSPAWKEFGALAADTGMRHQSAMSEVRATGGVRRTRGTLGSLSVGTKLPTIHEQGSVTLGKALNFSHSASLVKYENKSYPRVCP